MTRQICMALVSEPMVRAAFQLIDMFIHRATVSLQAKEWENERARERKEPFQSERRRVYFTRERRMKSQQNQTARGCGGGTFIHKKITGTASNREGTWGREKFIHKKRSNAASRERPRGRSSFRKIS